MSSSENDHALIGEVSLSVDLENYNPNEHSNSLFFHVAIGDSRKNISNIDIPDLFLPFNRPGTENELSDNLDLDWQFVDNLWSEPEEVFGWKPEGSQQKAL